MARSLTWPEVWRERLRRHYLAAPAAPECLAEVVGQVCGIHAQVAASAELSLSLRVAGLTASDVRAALWQTRSLVKTYGVRGTLHLLPSHEVDLWLAALRSVPPRPRPPSSPPPISAEQRAEIVQAMRQALDGRQLTRDELGQALADLLGEWVNAAAFPAFGSVWRPWQVALSTAAHQGVVCFGPSQGNRVTYVRLDQWLPDLGRGPGPRAMTQADDHAQPHAPGPASSQAEDREHAREGEAAQPRDCEPAQAREPGPAWAQAEDREHARDREAGQPRNHGQVREQAHNSRPGQGGPHAHHAQHAQSREHGQDRPPGHLSQPGRDQARARQVDGQAALQEVVRRYVAAYGPTTHVEVARWLGTTPAAARDLLHGLDLEPVDVEGWQAFTLAEPPATTATPAASRDPTPAAGTSSAPAASSATRDPTPAADTSDAPAASRDRRPAADTSDAMQPSRGAASAAETPSRATGPTRDTTSASDARPLVHLLPHFDCYVVGCHPRSRLIPPSAPAALHQGTAATFSVLLLDGVVAGLWQRQRRGKSLELIVDPFVELSRAQRAGLDEQARRLGEILGLEPKLSLGHVEPRAHL